RDFHVTGVQTCALPICREHMRDFLRNQGYFYAQVADTVIYHDRKANVIFSVNTGLSYLVDSVTYQFSDTNLLDLKAAIAQNSLLEKNKLYTHILAGEERSRLTEAIRDQGYYKFSGDNISFELDTMDKSFFRDLANPFESAINFITLQNQGRKPSLDIQVNIH